MSGIAKDLALEQVFGPLLSPDEIIFESGRIADYDAPERRALLEFCSYLANFLAMPHPDLGRPGPVCPFVPIALNKELIRLTAAQRALTGKQEMASAMEALLDTFRAMPPVTEDPVAGDAVYKTIIAVLNRLPRDSAPALLDAVQSDLKPSFIRKGLMIGRFYPHAPGRGLHSVDFRPFDAPKPSFAVRHMTVFDTPFVIDRDENIVGYLARFGDEGRQRLVELIEQRDLGVARTREIKELIEA